MGNVRPLCPRRRLASQRRILAPLPGTDQRIPQPKTVTHFHLNKTLINSLVAHVCSALNDFISVYHFKDSGKPIKTNNVPILGFKIVWSKTDVYLETSGSALAWQIWLAGQSLGKVRETGPPTPADPPPAIWEKEIFETVGPRLDHIENRDPMEGIDRINSEVPECSDDEHLGNSYYNYYSEVSSDKTTEWERRE